MLLQMAVFSLLMAAWYSSVCVCVCVCVCIYTPHIFIHSSVDGNLDCFHTLAVVNTTAMNIKKQIHDFADKDLSSQSYSFSNSHVWMWELDHKEGWGLQNWCFWTVVLEKTPESPLNSKEIKQSILREINCEYSLEGLMLKPHILVTWYEQPTLEKSLMLGKIKDRRRRGH